VKKFRKARGFDASAGRLQSLADSFKKGMFSYRETRRHGIY
jgi:hypothetical protein